MLSLVLTLRRHHSALGRDWDDVVFIGALGLMYSRTLSSGMTAADPPSSLSI